MKLIHILTCKSKLIWLKRKMIIIILYLIEILKLDWLRQILYTAILCFLPNLYFLYTAFTLYIISYWQNITFLNPVNVPLYGILHYDAKHHITIICKQNRPKYVHFRLRKTMLISWYTGKIIIRINSLYKHLEG